MRKNDPGCNFTAAIVKYYQLKIRVFIGEETAMKAGGRLKLAIKLNLLILIFVLAGAYGIIGYTGNMKYARAAASEQIADAVQSRDPKIGRASCRERV